MSEESRIESLPEGKWRFHEGIEIEQRRRETERRRACVNAALAMVGPGATFGIVNAALEGARLHFSAGPNDDFHFLRSSRRAAKRRGRGRTHRSVHSSGARARSTEVTSHMAKAETSDKVSSLAARWLQKVKDKPSGAEAGITVGELKTLCASLVRQDETQGLREKLKAAKARIAARKAKTKP